MQQNYRWGVDLGGTKTECVVLRYGGTPEVIARKRIPTESYKGYDHILHRIQTLVQMVQQETGLQPEHIGFGTPGTLDPATKQMKNCNTTVLNGRPLHTDLQTLLGVPVSVANDANCFALAETLMGAVPKVKPHAEVVFGIIMGTGVGGGVVVNGRVLGGSQGIAGEWGHNFLDASGGPCYCGKTGCVETILSGTGLQLYYQNITGTTLALPQIMQRYADGNDSAATATAERLINMFGRALAVVVNILDPDVIVLGGGVGNIDLLYTRGAESVCRHIFNTNPVVTIVKPLLGDSAGVFGAALLEP